MLWCAWSAIGGTRWHGHLPRGIPVYWSEGGRQGGMPLLFGSRKPSRDVILTLDSLWDKL